MVGKNCRFTFPTPSKEEIPVTAPTTVDFCFPDSRCFQRMSGGYKHTAAQPTQKSPVANYPFMSSTSLLVLTLLILPHSGMTGPRFTTPPHADETSTTSDLDSDNSRQSVARLESALLRQPRPGTLFGRVLDWHSDQDTLADYIRQLQQAATANNSAAQLLLGLVLIQQERTTEALPYLQSAAAARPTDPVAAWQLGKLLLQSGQHAAASTQLQRALTLKPVSSDLPAICRDCASAIRLSETPQQLAEFWSLLPGRFPGNSRLAELAAAQLQAAGFFDSALKLLRNRSTSLQNPADIAACNLQIARLQVQLGQPEPALQTLQAELQNLAPDSWLARQVLSEIDALPQHASQPDRLIQWYQSRLQQSPDNEWLLEKLVRLQLQHNQPANAVKQLENSLPRFPSSTRLQRLAIDASTAAGNYAAAELAFRKLIDSRQPASADVEAFAAFMLHRPDLPPQQRQEQATALWMQAAQTGQPTVSQLQRIAQQQQQLNQFPAAHALLLQALQLEPDNSGIHEALGQLLLQQNRRDDALLAFQQMAAGTRHTAGNLRELTRLCAQSGFPDAAITAAAAAAQLDPEPSQLLALSQLLRESTAPIPTAVAQQCLILVQQAESSAESLSESAKIFAEKALALLANDSLASHVAQLTDRLNQDLTGASPDNSADATATATKWLELAVLQRAQQNSTAALVAIRKALQLQPQSPVLLQTAATICQEQGLLAESLQLLEQWLTAAPGQRAGCLPRIAQLQLQLGNRRAAADAILQLDTASDISPELAVTAADTLSAAGRRSDALRLLRKILRQYPTDSDLHLTLCELLWAEGQKTNALQACWLAFNNSSETPRLKTLATTLVSLHNSTNRMAELHDTLRVRSRSTAPDPLILRQTMLLAEAADVPDIALACRLALLETPDASFDDRISVALQAVATADYTQAIELLRSLDSQPRTIPEITRIAACAAEIPAPLLSGWNPSADTARQLQTERLRILDQLLQQKRWQQARELATSLSLNLTPHNPLTWPLHLRLAVCHWHLNQRTDAIHQLQQLILETELPAATENTRPTPLSLTRGIPDTSFWVVTFEHSARIFLDNGTSTDLTVPGNPSSALALRQAELTALCGLLLSETWNPAATEIDRLLQQQADDSASAARRLWAYRRLKSIRDGGPAGLRNDSFQMLRLQDSEAPAAVIAELLATVPAGRNSSPLQLLQDGDKPLTAVQAQQAIHALTLLTDSLPPSQLLTALQTIADRCDAPLTATTGSANPLTSALQLRCHALQARRLKLVTPQFAELLQTLQPLVTQPQYAELIATLLTSDLSLQTDLTLQQLQASTDFWIQHGRLLPPHLPPDASLASLPAATSRRPGRRIQTTDLRAFLPTGDLQLLSAILAAAERLAAAPQLSAFAADTAVSTQPLQQGPAVRRCLLQLLLSAQSDTADITLQLQQLEHLLPDAAQPVWLRAELLEQQGRDAEALAALHTLNSSDGTTRRRRALSILRLAARLQQPEPARRAWLELAGMQLTVDERRECARNLRLCGLADEYHSLVQRTSPEVTETSLQRLQDELMMYQQQGRLEEVRDLAERILQRPTGGGMKFRRHSRFTADDLRRSAENALRQANSAVSSPEKTP